MLRKFIIIIISIMTVLSLYSTKISITDFNIYRTDANVTLTDDEKNASEIIYKSILKADFEGLLKISKLPALNSFNEKIIKSELDASEACDLFNVDYLLYGFVEKTNKYYNAEIKLYENSTKSVKKTFYVKSEIVDVQEIADEISYKFIQYMNKSLGLTELHEERKRSFGGLGIYNSAGYWFPLGDWWDIETGLVCFETGLMVIPLNHIARKRNFAFNIKFGFITQYGLAMNKPGFLNSYNNSLFFRIPVQFSFELHSNHALFIDLGPQLHLDILYQEKLYDNPEVYSTAAFSLYWGYGYEYWFGKKKLFCLGIKNSFDFTLYETYFIDTKIQLYTVARIPIQKNKKGEK